MKASVPPAATVAQAPTKLPTKPLPHTQVDRFRGVVREAREVRNNTGAVCGDAGRGGFARGRGNWGSFTDGVLTSEANKDDEEGATNEMEEEDREMTLEEYEKPREEKRKALLAMRNEERKVEIDEELQSIKQLSVKKGNDDVFVKVWIRTQEKRKKMPDRDERSKKSMRITEFLKPAEGERHCSAGGRGQYGGGFGGGGISTFPTAAPSIEDPGPMLIVMICPLRFCHSWISELDFLNLLKMPRVSVLHIGSVVFVLLRFHRYAIYSSGECGELMCSYFIVALAGALQTWK
ncbi:hypothetical protein OPV22_033700 [Ensete ventricosum]|uniref:Hyaluronan/mRNA-binding protein domain-containing protein n=1 Tax=Ensete ventricosum TaxID=4639 RepID=A0AAV8PV02_ENSVE|nr:hypothetical protein OPV22_033700 [Ensete ventricosum]